jgi:hypothetical protein
LASFSQKIDGWLSKIQAAAADEIFTFAEGTLSGTIDSHVEI